MTSSLLVEFCGLPGAGKTTLAGRLLDSLGAQGLDAHDDTALVGPDRASIRRIARKVFLTARQVLDRPAASARVGGRIAAGAHPRSAGDAADLAARFVQWTVTQRLFALARAARGVHVFGEGVGQALLSIGLRGEVAPVLTELDRRPASWVKPDLVVVVEVTAEVAADRLRRRGSRHSRTQALVGDAQLRELRRAASAVDRLAGWLPTGGGGTAQVVRVSGSDDPSAALRLVTQAIRSLTQGTRCVSSLRPLGDPRQQDAP